MVLQILLIISIILQIFAAITALRLTRRTKFNSAWFLFAIAVILISIQLATEAISIIDNKPLSYKSFSHWSTLLLSLCVSIGIFYMKKIINYIETINKQRQLTEKRILNTIISTEEKERQRFSKDLHDDLGPLLSSAKLSLSAIDISSQSSKNIEIISNATYVINEAIKSLKDISNNISPHVLQSFGISSALNNFITKLSLPKTLKIDYSSNLKDKRFNEDVEVIFYRIGCELINNAIKHSQGTLITVRITYSLSLLTLIIEDDGIGLEINSKNGIDNYLKTGMGISNLISRIDSLNGEVDFISSDKGTSVTVKVKI